MTSIVKNKLNEVIMRGYIKNYPKWLPVKLEPRDIKKANKSRDKITGLYAYCPLDLAAMRQYGGKWDFRLSRCLWQKKPRSKDLWKMRCDRYTGDQQERFDITGEMTPGIYILCPVRERRKPVNERKRKRAKPRVRSNRCRLAGSKDWE